jgi:uncharacterized protein YlxW (UPF0749 family)
VVLSKPSLARSIGLLVVGLALGLLLAFQWNAAPRSRLEDASYGRDRTSLTISRLEAEQQALKQQVSDLRASLDAAQSSKAQSAELLKDLSQELARNKMLAGLAALRGNGVELTLNDSNRRVVPSVVNPETYLVHDYDIRDVVNLLWAAGSEAISINDERIVATTSIYCVGATIMVNDTRMSPPYHIRAIGPAERQGQLLKNPLFLSDLRNRVASYGLEFKIAQMGEILIPAYEGSFGAVYASLSNSQ